MSEPAASRAPRASTVTLPEVAPPFPALLDFLDSRFPQVGREVWRRRLEAGAVADDHGAAVGVETPYRPRMRLHYRREVAVEPVIPFEETILFQDDRLLVADKPHYLPVIPSGPWVNECLLYRLMRKTGCEHLVPLHRLDRETAGLVLFSVDPGTRARYGGLFMKGRVTKRYEAIARAPSDGRTAWTVEGRIEKGEPWFRVREVEGVVNARTRIRIIETRVGFGRFEIEPQTGKQHQIRVHMARIGCPIVNDWLYPDLHEEPKTGLEPPLLLLARDLAFEDPVTGESRAFHSHGHLAWPA